MLVMLLVHYCAITESVTTKYHQWSEINFTFKSKEYALKNILLIHNK